MAETGNYENCKHVYVCKTFSFYSTQSNYLQSYLFLGHFFSADAIYNGGTFGFCRFFLAALLSFWWLDKIRDISTINSEYRLAIEICIFVDKGQ